MNTFYIKTLGCKVNQYESQVIRENFLKHGYRETENPDEAELFIVNTCTVTSTSDSKSLRLIRSGLKKKKCVIATGCLVEDKTLDLFSLSGVRFIIKNKDKYRIPEIMQTSYLGTPYFESSLTDKVECTQGRVYPSRTSAAITGFKGHTRVFVKVQDGCSNLCSYCKVRVVRGPSRSRPLNEIMDECMLLIKNGSKEIVLTGICLGAYGRDLSGDLNLSKLVGKICRIPGDWRLRLSSIEPKDITEDLINQLKAQEKLCKHIHIPFQSGDDYILKGMNRPYKGIDYLNIVDTLRRAIPDIAISTDIMVGFPGERDGNFKNTVDFVKKVRPMRMHVFPFSKRKGTKAYNYKDDVTSAVKKEREVQLLSLAGRFSREFTKRFVNKEVKVLVEDRSSIEGYLQGYTGTYIKVYIDGPDSFKGKTLSFRLTLTKTKAYGILLLHVVLVPALIYASYKVQLG